MFVSCAGQNFNMGKKWASYERKFELTTNQHKNIAESLREGCAWTQSLEAEVKAAAGSSRKVVLRNGLSSKLQETTEVTDTTKDLIVALHDNVK